MPTTPESQPDLAARPKPKEPRRVFLNGFDMYTVGHQSFGQWRRPGDRSADKRRDLTYWTDLAKLLEKGDFNALFLADTYGVYDTYKGSAEPVVRAGAQFPMGDPVIVRTIPFEDEEEDMSCCGRRKASVLILGSPSVRWLQSPRTWALPSPLRRHTRRHT